MTEAEFLALLRPLAGDPAARGLTDDVAQLPGGLIVSTDTIVEGVHFLTTDPAEDVAWKLVAVNLSDLAAKGAAPVGILLNYPLSGSPAQAGAQSGDYDGEGRRSITSAIPTGPRPSPGGESAGESWDQAFVTGLAEVLDTFACPLIGGDTVSLPAGVPRVLTVTAIGSALRAPPRAGAKSGDALYVLGNVGDAGAGLAIARGAPRPAALLAAYRRPRPLLAGGRALAPHVHAMMDISDGLLIDASRIAAASNLAVTIDLALVPLSPDLIAHAGDTRETRLAAATAGDDYALLFAAAPDAILPIPATRIGGFAPGAGLTLHDAGQPLPLPARLGFEHRSSPGA